MEGKTHYERIIAKTEEEKRTALEELQRAFDERSEELAGYELEKSPEDLEILQKVEAFVDRTVARYGGDPKPLPLDHIYILRPGSISALTEGVFTGGRHESLGVKIGVEKEKSKLLFAGVVAHELFHLKSYKSARVGKSGEDVRLYRSGLSMINRKDPNKEIGEEKDYFAALEEAVVAECTRKFLDEIGSDSIFSEEATALAKFRDWVTAYYLIKGVPAEKIRESGKEVKYISNPQDRVKQVLAFSDDEKDRESYAAGMFRGLHENGEVEPTERYPERKMLYELLDKLVAGSGGKFKSRDEIFDEFAKANFSGNYLPLARIVESILGKGSFRKLADEFSEEPEKDTSEAIG